MNPFTRETPLMSLLRSQSYIGFNRETNKTQSYSHKRMLAKQITKRRKANKIARKQRKLTCMGPGRNKRLL